jgi:hypothetical protein
MADPTRWLDDPNAPTESQSLLRSLSAPKPYTEAAHTAIGAKVSQTVATAPLATAATKFASLKLWLLSGAVVVGGAVALISSQRGENEAEQPKATAPMTATPAPPVAPIAEAPRAAPVVSEPAPPAKNAEHPAPRPTERDDLAVEASLLEQARTAGSPARALSLLREHERRFPRGSLSAERLFLNGKVHAESGNATAARRYAAELERRFPASSYVPRLRTILAEHSSPK